MSSDTVFYLPTSHHNLGRRNYYSPVQRWKPLPYLVGLMTGIVLSTMVLVRPDTRYINNVYVMISVDSDQTIRSEKILSDDIIKRLENEASNHPLLADQVAIKEPFNYVIIESSEKDISWQIWATDTTRLNLYVPTDKKKLDGIIDVVNNSTTLTHFHCDLPKLAPLVVLWQMCKGTLKESHWVFFGPSSVYVNTVGLEAYLTGLDSSKLIWLVGLAPDNKTCVWDSGMVFSHATLKLVCPVISKCITDAVASPERGDPLVNCIEKTIGYACTSQHPDHIGDLFLDVSNKTLESSSNFSVPVNITSESEMKKNTTKDNVIKCDMLERALVIYPAKDHKFITYFHHYYVLKQLNYAQEKLLHQMSVSDFLQEQLPGGNKAVHSRSKLLNHDPVTSVDDILTWELITHDMIYSEYHNQVVTPLTGSYEDNINVAVRKAVNYLNKQNTEEYKFRKLVAAYQRIDPLVGIEYILEFESTVAGGVKIHRVVLIGLLSPPKASPLIAFDSKTVVNVVVVVDSDNSGKLEDFIKNFEEVLIKDKKIGLTVLEMKGSTKDNAQKKKNQLRTFYLVSLLQSKYPNVHIEMMTLDTPLSRERGISIVAKHLSPSNLVFLADVDIRFHASFLHRCRNFATVGQQAYFPMLFRRYDPELLSQMNHSNLDGKITEHSGYWLSQSHSLTCIYVADIINSFSQTGSQDVPPRISSNLLMSRLVQTGVHIIRSPDKDIWRPYDTRQCEGNMYGESYNCDTTDETPESHYVHSQLASLLFNHEDEHAMEKF